MRMTASGRVRCGILGWLILGFSLQGCVSLPLTGAKKFAPIPLSRIDPEILEKRYRSAQSRFVEVDRVRVHYRDEGAGPVIVLLHGSFGSLRTFDVMTHELRKKFRIIRYDQPPAGLSGSVPDDFSVSMEDFLGHFLDRLGVKEAVLLGTSSGGIIAYRYAARYPERVRALVLSNVPPSAPVDNAGAARRAPEEMQRKLMACTAAGEPRSEACWQVFLEFSFFRRSNLTPALIKEYTDLNRKPDSQRFSSMTPIMRDDVAVKQFLGQIRAPTLLVWGMEDYVLPPSTMTTLASRLSGTTVRQVSLPGVAHYPPLEAPLEVASATEKFLAQLDASGITGP